MPSSINREFYLLLQETYSFELFRYQMFEKSFYEVIHGEWNITEYTLSSISTLALKFRTAF